MNSAIHHLSASQMQAAALRDALRNPPVHAQKPARERRERARLVRRLRPAVV